MFAGWYGIGIGTFYQEIAPGVLVRFFAAGGFHAQDGVLPVAAAAQFFFCLQNEGNGGCFFDEEETFIRGGNPGGTIRVHTDEAAVFAGEVFGAAEHLKFVGAEVVFSGNAGKYPKGTIVGDVKIERVAFKGVFIYLDGFPFVALFHDPQFAIGQCVHIVVVRAHALESVPLEVIFPFSGGTDDDAFFGSDPESVVAVFADVGDVVAAELGVAGGEVVYHLQLGRCVEHISAFVARADPQLFFGVVEVSGGDFLFATQSGGHGVLVPTEIGVAVRKCQHRLFAAAKRQLCSEVCGLNLVNAGCIGGPFGARFVDPEVFNGLVAVDGFAPRDFQIGFLRKHPSGVKQQDNSDKCGKERCIQFHGAKTLTFYVYYIKKPITPYGDGPVVLSV